MMLLGRLLGRLLGKLGCQLGWQLGVVVVALNQPGLRQQETQLLQLLDWLGRLLWLQFQ